MINLICKNCNKEYRCKPYRKDKSLFCSRECSQIYRGERIRINTCINCEIEFTRPENPQREYKFCCYQCRADFDSKTSRIEKICKNCGELFHPNRNNSVQTLCSKKCRIEFSDNRKTSEARKIRSSFEYNLWRSAIFTRDSFTCQECGNKGYLIAHHIKPFSLFPKLRLDINNGITLCKKCHSTKHKGLRRKLAVLNNF